MSGVLFRDASALDGTGAVPFSADVLVEGNRTAEISPPGPAPSLPGIETVDCNGATLMPGLVEPHAHLSFVDQTAPYAFSAIPVEEHLLLSLRHAKLYLDQGFTSCFSAAATKPPLDVVVRSWPRPVRPSDELRVESEVLEARPSKSRPDQGLIKVKTTTLNQHGEVVQISVGNLIVLRRPK